MFTIDELLSKRNQTLAFEHLNNKPNGKGIDGMSIQDLNDYWKVNGKRLCDDIRNKEYKPSTILIREIINNKGKRRNIASLCSIDRLISRLLAQKLNRYFDPLLNDNTYAYRDNKGVVPAVEKCKEYMEYNLKYLIEIDLKNYFDTIPLDKLITIIGKYIEDDKVLYLIKEYLYCNVSIDNKISIKDKGLIQGNPISPVLSNLYLNDFDSSLDNKEFFWLRYADNIYIYFETYEEALNNYNNIINDIETYGLIVNKDKSGIFDSNNRTILGYDLFFNNDKVEIRKHVNKTYTQYSFWHDTGLEKINGTYHILSDGIINKDNYSILFENEQKKCYIPCEVTNQINIYSNVTLASNVLHFFNSRKIIISFFDKYGNTIGSFIPESYKGASTIILKQASNYLDEKIRFENAKKLEIANLHNIRANLKYYEKKEPGKYKESITYISDSITNLNKAKDINELMLIEAKARQQYYQTFNLIINNENFIFTKRTKRPPQDPINALISFGNTLLYTHFLHLLYKKGIDPRFGIVHASNNRTQSLNLDFADIFKPIIIDRIIFTLINKKMISASHFEQSHDGIYLNKEGKRIFLNAYEEKLNSKLTINNKVINYRKLLEQEVQKYKNYLLKDEKYKPYKYR